MAQNQSIEEELKVDANTLLGQWRRMAYDQEADQVSLRRFWEAYFLLEKGIYEKLLDDPDTEVRGTVKELADKYGISVLEMEEQFV